MKPRFLEFFAGGGMARAGLSPEWHCVFANDFDPKKAAVYRANWGDADLVEGDIARLKAKRLPVADLAWASFPCQDLSLAGSGRGLQGERSGMFWSFWQLLLATKRRPRMLVLENVGGTLTSRKGDDFKDICRALAELGYVFGALMVDAVHFLPQSRPRLFLIAVQRDEQPPRSLSRHSADPHWTPARLCAQVHELPRDLGEKWRWWRLPKPPDRSVTLSHLILDDPPDVEWNSRSTTARLLSLMSPTNLSKVRAAQDKAVRCVGTVYRRTRVDGEGKRQRAEVRFDDVAGCLRTPRGGSSRQSILVVEGQSIRSRLLSKHEAAALMGYEGWLPDSYNDAYHLLGDGLAVPVVRHLSKHLLLPIAQQSQTGIAA